MTQVPLTDTDTFEVIAPRKPRPRPEAVEEPAADAWVRHITEVVAWEIKHWRTARNLSAQQLADRCEQLGYAIPRTIITNIENRRRHTISIAEILVLSAALNVPPVLLIFPLGDRDPIDVTPRNPMPAWEALRWFAGTARPNRRLLGGVPELRATGALRQWEDASAVLDSYQRHEELVRRYQYVRDDTLKEIQRLAEPAGQDDEHRAEELRRRADIVANDLSRAMNALGRHRRRMRKLHLEPPALPAGVTVEGEDASR